jgi:hypothetical protein
MRHLAERSIIIDFSSTSLQEMYVIYCYYYRSHASSMNNLIMAVFHSELIILIKSNI